MVEWVKRMKDYGFDVVGSLAVNESPNDDEINSAKELAKINKIILMLISNFN